MADGDVSITLVLPAKVAAELDDLRWSLRMSRRELLRQIVAEGVHRRKSGDPDGERIAWREAAGMLDAQLARVDPEKALSVRQMFGTLDWGVTAEEDADDRERAAAPREP